MTGVTPGIPARLLLHAQHQAADGVNGGGLSSGAWRTRTLTTLVSNQIPLAGLATNQVALPIGNYEVIAAAMCQLVHTNQLRLYDVTGAAELVRGLSRYSDATGDGDAAQLMGRFSLSAASVIELQHSVFTTNATAGQGFAHQVAVGTEVFANLMIWKV